jgi:hypothetical protein
LSATTRGLLFLVLGIFLALRQDIWFWDDARLVFGLPIGLTYHLAYCFAAAALMALLVKLAWPNHLDSKEDARV